MTILRRNSLNDIVGTISEDTCALVGGIPYVRVSGEWVALTGESENNQVWITETFDSEIAASVGDVQATEDLERAYILRQTGPGSPTWGLFASVACQLPHFARTRRCHGQRNGASPDGAGRAAEAHPAARLSLYS